jgi:serine/threonine protein kinase
MICWQIFSSADEDAVIKISDFGLAKVRAHVHAVTYYSPTTATLTRHAAQHLKDGLQIMTTRCGTPVRPVPPLCCHPHTFAHEPQNYVAPEVILGRPYTNSVDMWSLVSAAIAHVATGVAYARVRCACCAGRHYVRAALRLPAILRAQRHCALVPSHLPRQVRRAPLGA